MSADKTTALLNLAVALGDKVIGSWEFPGVTSGFAVEFRNGMGMSIAMHDSNGMFQAIPVLAGQFLDNEASNYLDAQGVVEFARRFRNA